MKGWTEREIGAFTLAPGQKDRLVFDPKCPGLGLRITPKAKRFLVQWTDPATKAKVREPLGALGMLSLDQAQKMARTRLAAVANGVNPRAERLKVKAAADRAAAEDALTLDRLIAEWVALHLSRRRPRYRAEAERALRVGFACLLTRPAARIERADVRRVLDEMVATERHVLAARTLAYGRAAYAWAGKRELVHVNPFQGLPIAPARVQRDRTLSEAETREVWAAAGNMTGPFGPAIRLLLLTLARRDEIAGMRWPEIEAKQWVIPSGRTKNAKPHVVHLPTAARDVLAGIARVEIEDAAGRPILSELVFTTTGKTPLSGWSKAKLALDAAILKARKAAAPDGKADALPPWTYHDFRRSGVSFLASAGFDPIVADKLLNHQPAALRGVAAVYQRYSFDVERAKALDAWAAHVVAVPAVATVVQLRAAR